MTSVYFAPPQVGSQTVGDPNCQNAASVPPRLGQRTTHFDNLDDVELRPIYYWVGLGGATRRRSPASHILLVLVI